VPKTIKNQKSNLKLQSPKQKSPKAQKEPALSPRISTDYNTVMTNLENQMKEEIKVEHANKSEEIKKFIYSIEKQK
jgi:hypothetical protein